MLDSDLSSPEKHYLLLEFDKVFGLNLNKKIKIPKQIIKLANQRQEQREKKNYKEADTLRKQIESKGYQIEDTDKSYIIKKT